MIKHWQSMQDYKCFLHNPKVSFDFSERTRLHTKLCQYHLTFLRYYHLNHFLSFRHPSILLSLKFSQLFIEFLRPLIISHLLFSVEWNNVLVVSDSVYLDSFSTSMVLNVFEKIAGINTIKFAIKTIINPFHVWNKW